MKKPLKTYFDSAKESPSLINSSDIRNLVEAQRPGGDTKLLLTRGLKMSHIIGLSLVAALGIKVFFFQNDSISDPKIIATANGMSGSSKSGDTKSTTAAQNSLKIENAPSSTKDTTIPENTRIVSKEERQSPTETSTGNITGIRLIDLTNEEFEKLGVRVEPTRVIFYKNSEIPVEKLNSEQKKALSSMGFDLDNPWYIAKTVVTMNGVRSGERANEDEYKDIGIASIVPRVSTNYHNGKLMAMAWAHADSAYPEQITENARILSSAQSINTLLPVRTVLKDPKAKTFKETDVILWYKVTPEFVGLLPERYKTPLLNELASVDNPESSVIAGERFFDTWRTHAGAILESRIYPNPVREAKATLDFTLEDSRFVSVSLHDIFGRKIAELRTGQDISAGNYKWEIALKDVAQGMYLVSLQTDKGERAVQRLIIE